MAIKFWKSAAVTLEQSATLYQFPTNGDAAPWYTPMVAACKP
jgi:hypothetical protein